MGGLSYGIDPRTRERAQRLCQGIFCPIIRATKSRESETILLELIDVGAGSGNLSAAICRQIQEIGKSAGFNPKFRLWFVDLEPADPARFFRDRELRGTIDSLTFLGDDYRSWLDRAQPQVAASGLRIALVSRLFNNLSRFSIHRFTGSAPSPLFEKIAIFPDSGDHLPHHCLAPSGKGADALVISNARLTLLYGRTFAQASLYQFYHGLFLLSSPNGTFKNSNNRMFLPVRSFNPECLVTSNGRSVISCLVENCDYLVIEDADLRPQDLVDHMKTFSLHSITIQDLTKALGLTGNQAYVIWLNSKPKEEASFGGERIW